MLTKDSQIYSTGFWYEGQVIEWPFIIYPVGYDREVEIYTWGAGYGYQVYAYVKIDKVVTEENYDLYVILYDEVPRWRVEQKAGQKLYFFVKTNNPKGLSAVAVQEYYKVEPPSIFASTVSDITVYPYSSKKFSINISGGCPPYTLSSPDTAVAITKISETVWQFQYYKTTPGDFSFVINVTDCQEHAYTLQVVAHVVPTEVILPPPSPSPSDPVLDVVHRIEDNLFKLSKAVDTGIEDTKTSISKVINDHAAEIYKGQDSINDIVRDSNLKLLELTESPLMDIEDIIQGSIKDTALLLETQTAVITNTIGLDLFALQLKTEAQFRSLDDSVTVVLDKSLSVVQDIIKAGEDRVNEVVKDLFKLIPAEMLDRVDRFLFEEKK